MIKRISVSNLFGSKIYDFMSINYIYFPFFKIYLIFSVNDKTQKKK